MNDTSWKVYPFHTQKFYINQAIRGFYKYVEEVLKGANSFYK